MNTDGYEIAAKYARACIHVFGHQINKDTITLIRSAVRYLEERPVFSQLLLLLSGKSNLVQKEMILRYLQHLRLPSYFAPLCALFIKKKHVFLFACALQHILNMWYAKEQVQTITLYAPHVLSERERDAFIRFMEQKRGKKVFFFECILQPELIAGIKIVSSDGYVWEYSLLKQITKITAILRQEGIHRES